MVYNKLYVQVIIRVILISLTCFVIVFLYLIYHDLLVTANLVLFLCIQIWLLIKYLNRLNNDLANFFMAIENDDTTLVFKRRSPAKSFEKLYERLDYINEKMQQAKIENYRQHQFFKVVTEHINTGLITINQRGEVELYNQAAKNILRIPRLQKIEQLNEIQEGFAHELLRLSPNQNKLIKLKTGDDLQQIAVKTSEYKFLDKTLKLISLQDIKAELEDKELDSWQKLIRVLTHEIMNSIGPITSTIKTIKEFLITNNEKSTKAIAEINQEIVDDTVRGLNIIEERSDGMLDFVEKFRSLTLIPKIEYNEFEVHSLCENILHLMSADFSANNINCTIEIIPKNLKLIADKNMIEQILLNLIKNAVQSFELSDKKSDNTILIKAYSAINNQPLIEVTDNGPGIPEDHLDKIFIPFFTTKPGGSGIGLNLARQIMRLHKGSIRVHSKPDEETTFTLRF
ncbi:MAG: hypothetical protein JXJ22_02080 [Bacteroidales bacterium]|nr:hypothetical protein [Bacteroidales bacterium]